MGLMDYKARYYSSLLGRFIQPDTIIPEPNNPQSWNRFAYTLNNPVRFTDPSGNRVCDEDDCLEKIKNGTGKNSKPITVKALLDGGFQDPQALIRAYIRAHPAYEPLKDPDLIDDRVTLSFVATAKMQADNPNDYQHSVITPESAMRGVLAFTPAIVKTLDLGEVISGNGPPFAVGFGADALLSYLNDKGINNHSERFSRALIVGLEGVAVQQVSFAVMGGSGALGAASGPVDFAIMLSVYGTTDIALSTYFAQINEDQIFPYLKERFGH